MEEAGEAEWKRSKREREKGEMGEEAEALKGGEGMPVNSWTMARKLEVSVVRTVVGARREARERFLELRGGAAMDVELSGGCCTED